MSALRAPAAAPKRNGRRPLRTTNAVDSRASRRNRPRQSSSFPSAAGTRARLPVARSSASASAQAAAEQPRANERKIRPQRNQSGLSVSASQADAVGERTGDLRVSEMAEETVELKCCSCDSKESISFLGGRLTAAFSASHGRHSWTRRRGAPAALPGAAALPASRHSLSLPHCIASTRNPHILLAFSPLPCPHLRSFCCVLSAFPSLRHSRRRTAALTPRCAALHLNSALSSLF
jgi:hypothetical protein